MRKAGRPLAAIVAIDNSRLDTHRVEHGSTERRGGSRAHIQPVCLGLGNVWKNPQKQNLSPMSAGWLPASGDVVDFHIPMITKWPHFRAVFFWVFCQFNIFQLSIGLAARNIRHTDRSSTDGDKNRIHFLIRSTNGYMLDQNITDSWINVRGGSRVVTLEDPEIPEVNSAWTESKQNHK